MAALQALLLLECFIVSSLCTCAWGWADFNGLEKNEDEAPRLVACGGSYMPLLHTQPMAVGGIRLRGGTIFAIRSSSSGDVLYPRVIRVFVRREVPVSQDEQGQVLGPDKSVDDDTPRFLTSPLFNPESLEGMVSRLRALNEQQQEPQLPPSHVMMSPFGPLASALFGHEPLDMESFIHVRMQALKRLRDEMRLQEGEPFRTQFEDRTVESGGDEVVGASAISAAESSLPEEPSTWELVTASSSSFKPSEEKDVRVLEQEGMPVTVKVGGLQIEDEAAATGFTSAVSATGYIVLGIASCFILILLLWTVGVLLSGGDAEDEPSTVVVTNVDHHTPLLQTYIEEHVEGEAVAAAATPAEGGKVPAVIIVTTYEPPSTDSKV
eukprot:TRINITY_DN498_c0_g1_i1.p1 TRINITY_DN498_c0_g1~~TRINITY_DN498_c0_g1_i1.p1  ORF type:complete len:390 (+),score=118.22 TRINITY_DN498_c0_g1_i1:31-1170(+)